TSLGQNQAALGPSIIDTGTSISFIPGPAVTKLASTISATAGYKSVFGNNALSDGQCVTTAMSASAIDAALPPMHITFAGAAVSGDLPATKSYLIFQGSN